MIDRIRCPVTGKSASDLQKEEAMDRKNFEERKEKDINTTRRML